MPRGPDPLLTALVAVERLLPIAALVILVRAAPPVWLGALGLGGALLAAMHGARAIVLSRRSLRGAVHDAALSFVRRSAARLRGGANDELLQTIWRAISARQQLAESTEPTLWGSAIALPLAYAIAWWLDGSAAAATIVAAAALAVVVRVPLARIHRRALVAVYDAYSALASELGHGLRALEDLQAHGLAAPFAARLDARTVAVGETEAVAVRAGKLATWVPLFAGALALVPVVIHRFDVVGGRGLAQLGTLAALGPLAIGLARGLSTRARQRGEARALDLLVASPPDLADPTDPVPLMGTAPIEWRAVTFRYPPRIEPHDLIAERSADGARIRPASHDVLVDASVRWAGRRPLVLLGPNGSGKSTLIALLLRIVDPDRGAVLVAGVDLRQAALPTYRRSIAYVSQRPLVLEGMRVGEAIRLVAPEATDAALLAALDEVDLGARLRTRGLPPLDVPCASLSVGEAQRVAIARALVRDAKLWILDEPEAGLDPDARVALRALLERQVAAGRQVILATQHPEVAPEGASVLRLPLNAGERVDVE